MSFDELGEALEMEVELRRPGRLRSSAGPFLAEAPIDPGSRETCLLGGHMVVTQALRGVQDLRSANAEVGLHMLDQIGEIARIGLVGADVLGRVDRIEIDAELLVARREAHPIDIRENGELVMPLEVGECFGRIRKRRPRGDRGAEPVVEIDIDARAPNLREPGVDDGEQRRIA